MHPIKVEIQDNGTFRSLVATEKIRLGETILMLPEVVQEVRDRYSVEALPGVHIDCGNSPVGSINHSCDPSAAVRHMRIVAWKCLEQGEAITIDYRKTETHLAESFKCSCCGTWMEW